MVSVLRRQVLRVFVFTEPSEFGTYMASKGFRPCSIITAIIFPLSRQITPLAVRTTSSKLDPL